MPRIQNYGQHRTDAPGPTGQARATYNGEGQGLQTLGNTLSQISGVLQAKEERESLIDAKNAASDVEITLSEEIEKLRQNAPRNGADHAKNALSLTEKTWEDLSSRYTGQAAEWLASKRNQSRESVFSSEQGYEAQVRSKHYARVEEDVHSKEVNSILANPSQLQAANLRMADRVAAHGIDPETGYGLTPEQISSIVLSHEKDNYDAYAKGTLMQINSVSEARRFSDALRKPEMQERMRPNDYAQVLSAAERKIEELKRRDEAQAALARHDTMTSAQDYIAAMASGQPVGRPKNLEDNRLLAVLKPEDAKEVISDIHRWESFSSVVPTLLTGSRPEVEQVLTSENRKLSGIEDFIDKEKTREALQKVLEYRTSMLEKSPADYVVKHSSAVQDALQRKQVAATDEERGVLTTELMDTMVYEQRRLGVPNANLKVLTDSQIDEYRDIFKSSMTESGEDLYAAAEALKGETKGRYRIAIQNLYDAKAAPRGLSIIADMESVSAAQELASGLKDMDEHIKALDLKKEDYDTQPHLSEYLRTLAPSGSLANNTLFEGVSQEVLETVYATNALAVQYRRAQVSDYQKAAAEATINGRYDFYGDIRVPKIEKIEAPISRLRTLMQDFDSKYGDSINWEGTGSYFGKIVPAEEVRGDIVRAIEDGTMRAVTKPDDSGIALLTETGAALETLTGEPFYIPWKDLKMVVPKPLVAP